MPLLVNQTIIGVVKEVRLVLMKRDNADNMKVKTIVPLIIMAQLKKSMAGGIKMWKDILKLDPDEAREFNELGDKYAPDDMEEASLNRNMRDAGNQITKDTKTYNEAKSKIEAMKNRIATDDYMIMRGMLDQMKEDIGTESFSMSFNGLKSFSRNYPIFFR